MPIACSTVAGTMAVTSQLKENLKTKLQESIESTESFQANHYIHQRALRYNANTIVTYPKLPTQLLIQSAACYHGIAVNIIAATAIVATNVVTTAAAITAANRSFLWHSQFVLVVFQYN